MRSCITINHYYSIVEFSAITVEFSAITVEFSAIIVEFSAIVVEFSPSVADYSPKWLGAYREVFGQAITNAVFTRDTLTCGKCHFTIENVTYYYRNVIYLR